MSGNDIKKDDCEQTHLNVTWISTNLKMMQTPQDIKVNSIITSNYLLSYSTLLYSPLLVRLIFTGISGSFIIQVPHLLPFALIFSCLLFLWGISLLPLMSHSHIQPNYDKGSYIRYILLYNGIIFILKINAILKIIIF